MVFLGSLSGACCGGFQNGMFGRKKSLMLDSFIFGIGVLFVAFAPNFNFVLIGRFINGHSTTSAMVTAPIYTAEICQPHVRKTTGNFTWMCFVCGWALAFVLGNFLKVAIRMQDIFKLRPRIYYYKG